MRKARRISNSGGYQGLIGTEKEGIQMKSYRVTLHRDYLVEVEARNADDAKQCVEFFLSDPVDGSTKEEREKHSFRIREVELVTNDAAEAEEIS
jgi:hypothetical protein